MQENERKALSLRFTSCFCMGACTVEAKFCKNVQSSAVQEGGDKGQLRQAQNLEKIDKTALGK